MSRNRVRNAQRRRQRTERSGQTDRQHEIREQRQAAERERRFWEQRQEAEQRQMRERQQAAIGQQTGYREEERQKKKKVRSFYDYDLLLVIIFLTAFGLIMIYSSSAYNAQVSGKPSTYYMMRQAQIAAVGIVIMLGISRLDYHFFSKLAIVALAFGYICEILVTFTPLGISVNGKKRWLGKGSLRFQPAEVVKIVVIIVLAVMITKLGQKINDLRIWAVIAALIGPMALLVTINNLSSGIIIFGIAFVMMFIACKIRWPFVTFAGGVAFMFLFAPSIAIWLEKIGLLHAYQLSRILVWKNPENYAQSGGYQVLQGLYAIGSGGLLGKGLGQSIQKLSFLPEPQNDMIFAVICEELGLFGAVAVIFLFLFMIYRFMAVAGNAPDLFGAMLVSGVMAHIAIQVVLNIAVVTNVIPNTGITLPFISYGGTSVLFLMVEMGMVLSVAHAIKLEK